MNILMVGHSGAGKTSFMAGMYKYLGDSSDGYGIRAKNSNQKRQLERMAQQLSYGRYPSSTDVQQMYNFEFTCNGDDVVPFNWMDYRGGILLSDDPDEADMDKFMEALAQADALVVFLDGTKLIEKTSKWNMEYDILLSCIANSLNVKHQSWFPICFVVTKCDLVPNGASFYGLNRFSTLFEQINSSKTVGAMLLQCAITSDSYFTPFLALSYCIYGGTPIYIQKRNEAMNNAANRYNYHRPETLLGWLGAGVEELFNAGAKVIGGVIDEDWGWETELDKANSAEWDYNKEKNQLEFLQTIASDLKEKLEKWSDEDIVSFF